ncbi:MAG: OmpA family protein [Lewinellaceae bacterium]|nr:OmpA family protein [Lewinellaceae bacterium]
MKKLAFGFVLLAAAYTLSAQDGLPRILPAEVNSGYDEWGPVASPEGRALYFSRLGHPQNMGESDAADIWITYRYPNGQWPRAVNAGAPLNSRQDERVVGVHASGRRLYLYRPDIETLFYSDRHGRAWQRPMPIQIDSFSLKGKDARFAFHPDGTVLLLSFGGQGSMGGRDIYASFLKGDGHYSSPKPLNPPANSSADEVGLWLAADGETLYFSSNRTGGLGGQDFYVIRRLDEGWSKWTLPLNLGANVNSREDDLFLSMPASGFPVYLLRPTEEGTLSLYESELPDSLLPQPVVLLSGKIRDAASGETLSRAQPRLHTLEGGVHLATPDILSQDGDFQVILPHGRDFGLSAAMNGYFPVSEPLELSGQTLEELDRENAQLLVSLSRDPAYIQRNEEIISLQLHLRELDEELIQINQERAALRRKLLATRQEDPDWAPPSDPELDALRHRYRQYQETTARDTILPDAYGETPAGNTGELRDMKERYDRYVQYQKKQQQTAMEAADGDNFLWDEGKSFERMEEEVRQNLKGGLAPKVEQELSASMLEAVKRDVAASLSSRERQQLELKEEELRRTIRQSFGNPAGGQESWTAKGSPAQTEWERQLKEDLKVAIEPKVREELRQELKDDIRAALANDITYWAKKETQAELQAEMNQKLQLQIEQEKRKALSAGAGADAVAPLQPTPATGTTYLEIQQDLLLVRAEPGMVIPLNTVVFETNKAELKPVAYKELRQVLEFLQQNEGLVVEIGVHSGSQLSHTNALSLTNQRANAIVRYLTEKGIEEARAIPKGYGKSFPIAEGNSLEAQRQNQRVEMRVISTAP